MQGYEIVASANPKGNFESIFVSGTPLPGTFMEIVPAVAKQGGRFTYRARSSAAGSTGPVAILEADSKQGVLPGTAYTSGSPARIYWPIHGEELNALLEESAGTGTSGEENIGDRLAISSDGMLQAAGGATSAPFYLLEHGGISATNPLKLVKYIG
jgi:hypothetical protein